MGRVVCFVPATFRRSASTPLYPLLPPAVSSAPAKPTPACRRHDRAVSVHTQSMSRDRTRRTLPRRPPRVPDSLLPCSAKWRWVTARSRAGNLSWRRTSGGEGSCRQSGCEGEHGSDHVPLCSVEENRTFGSVCTDHIRAAGTWIQCSRDGVVLLPRSSARDLASSLCRSDVHIPVQACRCRHFWQVCRRNKCCK